MVEIRPSKLSEGEILRILQEGGLGRASNGVTFDSSETTPRLMEPVPIHFDQLPRSRALKVNSVPTGRDYFRLADLLAFHDASFVENAYRVLLQRSPDAEGFKHYLGILREGASKVEVLGRLRYSPEGKLRGVHVQGLLVAMAKVMVYRIPVLGYAAEVIVSVLRLPTVVRNMRRFESFTVLSDESLRDDLNALAEVTSRNLNKINSRP